MYYNSEHPSALKPLAFAPPARCVPAPPCSPPSSLARQSSPSVSSRSSYRSSRRRARRLRIDRTLAASRRRSGSHSAASAASCPYTWLACVTGASAVSVAHAARVGASRRVKNAFDCEKSAALDVATIRRRARERTRERASAREERTHCLSSGIATPPMVCVRSSAEERRGMMSAAGRLSAERARSPRE